MRLNRIFTGGSAGSSSRGPEANDSPTPPRGGLSGLGGKLASLVARRSSGPPAPQSPLFTHADVLGVIAGKLSEGPRTEAGRNLLHMSLMNKDCQAAVAGNMPARHRLLQAPLVQKARQLAEKLAGSNNLEPQEQELCLTALWLLDRPHQAKVMSSVLPGSSPSDYHSREDIKQTELYGAYDKLASRSAHLDKTLRTELVTKATMWPYPHDTAMAVGGMGRGLAHLDAPLIDRLVDAATGQPGKEWCSQMSPVALSLFVNPLKQMSEKSRAQAIRALSEGLAHMNPGQRQRMHEAAMRIRDPQHQGWVLEGLGAQMKHLLPDQQDDLFARAMALTDPAHLARALAGLARSIGALRKERAETVLTEALQLPERNDEERRRKRQVVCALAAQVEHLAPPQRERLVARILSSRSTDEIEALGPGLGHVDPEQQDQLLDTVASLGNIAKASIIAGHIPFSGFEEPSALRAKPALAAALPSLEPARRDKVAALVLGICREGGDSATCDMAAAIGALGPHLEHLEEGRRDALLDQALRLLGRPQDTRARLLHTHQVMTRGLGAGLGALREDQCQALVTAVANMDSLLPSSGQDPSFAKRLMNYAESIAGLASGRQHLSTPQFEELIKAAGRVQAACEFADNDFQWNPEDLRRGVEYARREDARRERLRNEALGVALIGLAAA